MLINMIITNFNNNHYFNQLTLIKRSFHNNNNKYNNKLILNINNNHINIQIKFNQNNYKILNSNPKLDLQLTIILQIK